jgi:hypothetical protein
MENQGVRPPYPTGVWSRIGDATTGMAAYSSYIGVNGTFPDLDDMPLGVMFHNDGENGHGSSVYGPPSLTHLTPDEQQTVASFWAFTRAPFMLGGRLPLLANDTLTLSLLTNPEILQVQNASSGSQVLPGTASTGTVFSGWFSEPDNVPALTQRYVFLCNGDNSTQTLSFNVTATGLPISHAWNVRDLWAHRESSPVTSTVTWQLNAHASAMLLLHYP